MSSEKSSVIADNPEFSEKEIRYVPVEITPLDGNGENQINLLDLVKRVWDERRTLYIIVSFFTALAFFNYFFGPREFESTSVLIQESQTGGGQAQLLLQRLSGISIGSAGSGDVISPALYPQIVSSLEFQRNLLHQELEFEGLGRITLYEYFTEHYREPVTGRVYRLTGDLTIRLPVTLLRWGRNVIGWMRGASQGESTELIKDVEEDGRFLALSRSEQRALRELERRIIIEMERGLVTIRTHLPNAPAAAMFNYLVVEQMQRYIIDHRIEKARQYLEFTISQYEEAKKRYNESQRALANFMDQNVNLSSAVARIYLEDLQNERNLRYQVYNTLSQQVEQARLKLQEETPVFNVLQRSNIPNNPLRSSYFLLIATIFLGVIFGIVWIFTRNVFTVIRRHVTE